MQIQTGPTLGQLKYNIHSVRSTTCSAAVLEETDQILDGIDHFRPTYDWTDQTPLTHVRSDLRNRTGDFVETAGRLLGLGLGLGALGETARVASGAGFLTNTPMDASGWLSLGVGLSGLALYWVVNPFGPVARAAEKSRLETSIQEWTPKTN